MGDVYLATDTRLQRPVAIKFLSRGTANADGRARFQQEVRAVSSLNHPHILTVHESGEHDGLDYLVTEYVDGGTLKTWAQEPRTWRQVVELLIGVADALAAAHDAGILHRDVKPANILVDSHGYAKLADFGLAKLMHLPEDQMTRTAAEPRTRAGMVVGTVDYMSPEQLAGGAVDRRADVFSFGVVLYETLSGRRPFAGATGLHVVEAILHGTPPPIEGDIPNELRTVVGKALEKDPAERYQSMRELVVDLRRLVRHTAELTAPVAAARSTGSRRGAVVAIAAALLLAVAAAGVWWLRGQDGTAPAIDWIAVLPLENLSGDPGDEYFADGMTEELISTLAGIRSVRVISRTSVMKFKNSTMTLPEIARELGADAVIEGSVRRADGRIRVTAQLIHAATDAHLWANDFDRDFRDVLKLQAEIAEAIVREVKGQITPEESSRITTTRTVNPEAHDAYIRARQQLYVGTAESTRKSVALFEQAIRLQDDFAVAHAGLSWALQQATTLRVPMPTDRMLSAARRAVELDPNLAEAHAALAGALWENWDWQGAVAGYEKALELNPGTVDCGCYASVLAALGRTERGRQVIEPIIRANPLSSDAEWNYGLLLHMARDFAGAEEHYLRAVEHEPRAVIPNILLAMHYVQTGRPEPAREIFERIGLAQGSPMARVHVAAGRTAEARTILASIPPSQPYDRAVILTALGEKDAAVTAFEQAVKVRAPLARWLKVDPAFDSLRGNARFEALIDSLGFPD
jgi:TolB-like protein